MDPVIESDWHMFKTELFDDSPNLGNIARSWQWRERGLNPLNCQSNKTVLENTAEDILVQKPLKIKSCDLPGHPRSTFLMVFSPDGTKVASTHGNHDVYVSELASGKHVKVLKGHPRTPWCIAFHPSHPELIGSGCLGGQVRVWDIKSGDSEVWNVRNETVIASIAFHPREQLLVIATFNELYFWDWSQPAPFTKVCTNSVNEKVRYVAFDALGYKLITGISLWTPSGMPQFHTRVDPPSPSQPSPRRRDSGNNNDNPGNGGRGDGNAGGSAGGSARDMIMNSYESLVQRYDSLVRNYQRLFRVRHRLTHTPPPPNTIDRGTDPMETDSSPTTNWTRTRAGSASRRRNEDSGAGPSTSSSRRQDGDESGDGEGSSSRLLNLDVLSFDNNITRSEESPSSPLLRSTTSAFQPLNETIRSFRTIDQNERSSRLLPNPFSSSTGPYTIRRSGRTIFNLPPTDVNTNSSQTSETTATRPMGLSAEQARVELEMLRQRLRESHDRNQGSSRTSVLLSPTEFSNQQARTELERLRQRLRDIDRSHDRSETASRTSALTSPTDFSTQQARTELERLRQRLRELDRSQDQSPSSSPRRITSARDRPSSIQRPTMTNSSTQMTPGTSVDAQTINESLDLIRDILRDSGTRLLNLITDMSLSIASTPDRSPTRRGSSQPPSEAIFTPSDFTPRPLIHDRLLGSPFRRVLFSSSSDSDSDQSSEVSIFRTRNTTFQEDSQRQENSVINPYEMPAPQPTDRITVNLEENTRSERGPSRFRVRSNSVGGTSSTRERRRQNTDEPGPSTSSFSSSRPSTSRDSFWTRSNAIPPAEAYRKVRSGVTALQKHTVTLTDMWVRGHRVTMRELRTMWENLRRRVLSLHRETGRQDMPSYYTRSLLERCMMLTDVYDNVSRATPRGPRSGQRSERNDDTGTESVNTENSTTESQPGTSSQVPEESRLGQSSRTSQMRSLGARTLLQMRRRLTPGYRRRLLDDPPWRSRNIPLRHRYLSTTRSRREFDRSMEISATRHEIRMRAMQVLSVMFNMMMMCLEERGLSQLIITMLRTLKKALALTCLMLMTNRNANRSGVNRTVPFDPLNLIHIENSDHSESVDVDEPTEANSETVTRHETDEDPLEVPENTNYPSQGEPVENDSPVRTPKTAESRNPSPQTSIPIVESSNSNSQRWSNRLAVQIAAANRNTSATARSRREMYLESRKLKALHRTNPNAHPMIKKRTLPPIAGHRIPALRCLPRSKPRTTSTRNDTNESANEPVAGPSTATDNPVQTPRPGGLNDYEHMVHSIRLEHLHAVYLRNAARSRFRRLRTIRLYTPSAVREMFTHQSSNAESQPGNLSPVEMSPDLSTRRLFRFHGATVEPTNRSEERRPFQPVSNSSALPMMQVNDSPPTPEAQSAQPYRVPRIHEYLQPIILAQNAMVVDEDGNGSNAEAGGPGAAAGGVGARLSNMAGLLDAGIISEALPAPSHRVQAWDFTTGDTPQIADSAKNVVVQRCRIHNDASIDISKDGRILVALLPVPRLRHSNHWIGVYSLEWSRLGQCLHTAALEQSAVSVALSPTARHLAVGLGSRRFTTAQHLRGNVFALLYRLEPLENSSRTGLSPIKELEQNWEQGFTSLNCLRWAPQPGQGLVYANNTGQLIIMS